jgi:Hemerythrin HHE cation binding domain
MDIRDVLTIDHREAVKLLQLLCDSDNVDCCIAAQHRLVELVHVHTRAEEEIVYRALQRAQPQQAEPFLAHAEQEHRQVEQLLSELAEAPPAGADWRHLSRHLMDTMVSHIADEHDGALPLIGACFSAQERDEMATRFLQARNDVPWSPGEAGVCPLARWCTQRETALRA